MKKYQFIVLSGLVTVFSVTSIYDRWQLHEILEKQNNQNELESTTTSVKFVKNLIPSSLNSTLKSKESPTSEEETTRNQKKLISVSKIYIALSELSQWYYLRNYPKASEHEVYVWKNAVFAKIEQEGLWKEHFSWNRSYETKKKPNQVKGQEIGMMKRFDFVNLNDRSTWIFVQKFIDGMEGYHFHWRKAAYADCVPKGDVVAQARSAFSSYQEGEKFICRWSDTYQPHSKNDVVFFQNFKEKSWRKYSKTDSQEPALGESTGATNSDGILSKVANALIGESAPKIILTKGNLVRLPNDHICVFNSGKLNCLPRVTDSICLNSIAELKKLEEKKVEWNEVKEYSRQTLNRFETCESFNPELRSVSSLIKTKRKIKLRKSPGGKLLGVVPQGSILKVEDFFLESKKDKRTYYKVSFDGKKGFIYAGTEKTTDKWIGSVKFKKKSKTSSEVAKLMEKFKTFLRL